MTLSRPFSDLSLGSQKAAWKVLVTQIFLGFLAEERRIVLSSDAVPLDPPQPGAGHPFFHPNPMVRGPDPNQSLWFGSGPGVGPCFVCLTQTFREHSPFLVPNQTIGIGSTPDFI